MKVFLWVVLTIGFTFAAAASDFDSTAWLAKRARMKAEAIRLRIAYSNLVGKVKSPAENVTMTIETFPDGTIKSNLFAKKAQLFQENRMVYAENAVIRKYDQAGKIVAQIDAGRCVVDRIAKRGWIEGRAKLRYEKHVMDGVGAFFSSPEGYLSVKSKSDLKFTDFKIGGLK